MDFVEGLDARGGCLARRFGELLMDASEAGKTGGGGGITILGLGKFISSFKQVKRGKWGYYLELLGEKLIVCVKQSNRFMCTINEFYVQVERSHLKSKLNLFHDPSNMQIMNYYRQFHKAR